MKNDSAEQELRELRERLADMEACLPDDAYASKDWQQSGYPERVMWLRGMYEDARQELGEAWKMLGEK